MQELASPYRSSYACVRFFPGPTEIIGVPPFARPPALRTPAGRSSIGRTPRALSAVPGSAVSWSACGCSPVARLAALLNPLNGFVQPSALRSPGLRPSLIHSIASCSRAHSGRLAYDSLHSGWPVSGPQYSVSLHRRGIWGGRADAWSPLCRSPLIRSPAGSKSYDRITEGGPRSRLQESVRPQYGAPECVHSLYSASEYAQCVCRLNAVRSQGMRSSVVRGLLPFAGGVDSGCWFVVRTPCKRITRRTRTSVLALRNRDPTN